jgi:REP element-mobilizing transposase RayT
LPPRGGAPRKGQSAFGPGRPVTPSRDALRGPGCALVTVAVRERRPLFAADDVYHVCREFLSASLRESICYAPTHCFMPDHAHILVAASHPAADAWLGIVESKRRTGVWLLEHANAARWQKGFHARTLGNDEIASAAQYVWNNPVRAGLVTAWQDYPYSGAFDWREGIVG